MFPGARLEDLPILLLWMLLGALGLLSLCCCGLLYLLFRTRKSKSARHIEAPLDPLASPKPTKPDPDLPPTPPGKGLAPVDRYAPGDSDDEGAAAPSVAKASMSPMSTWRKVIATIEKDRKLRQTFELPVTESGRRLSMCPSAATPEVLSRTNSLRRKRCARAWGHAAWPGGCVGSGMQGWREG